jgi:hypothetical protein
MSGCSCSKTFIASVPFSASATRYPALRKVAVLCVKMVHRQQLELVIGFLEQGLSYNACLFRVKSLTLGQSNTLGR